MMRKLFGEIMAEYYATLGKLSQKFVEIKLIPAPEPYEHEFVSAASSADDSSYPFTEQITEHVTTSMRPMHVARTVTTTTRTENAPLIRETSWEDNVNFPPVISQPQAQPIISLPQMIRPASGRSLKQLSDELAVDWYYVDDVTGERMGPISFERMRQMRNEGSLTNESYVFCEGMDDWIQIHSHKTLPRYL